MIAIKNKAEIVNGPTSKSTITIDNDANNYYYISLTETQNSKTSSLFIITSPDGTYERITLDKTESHHIKTKLSQKKDNDIEELTIDFIHSSGALYRISLLNGKLSLVYINRGLITPIFQTELDESVDTETKTLTINSAIIEILNENIKNLNYRPLFFVDDSILEELSQMINRLINQLLSLQMYSDQDTINYVTELIKILNRQNNLMRLRKKSETNHLS